MSDVSFDEESSYQQAPIASAQPYLVRLVIGWGFAKDQKSAQMILIGTVIVAVVIAVTVPFLMREKEIPLPAPVVPMQAQTGGF